MVIIEAREVREVCHFPADVHATRVRLRRESWYKTESEPFEITVILLIM
jgi:hypothetical protein